MMDALSLWQMLEVVSSVDTIKKFMENIVMSGIATTSRLVVHVHVKTTRNYGISTPFVMVTKHYLVFIASFAALRLKTNLGFLGTIKTCSLMINHLLHSDHGPTIFSQLEYTVWRHSVHHVGL